MEGGICRILGYSSPSILSKCTVLRNPTEQEFINKRGRPKWAGDPMQGCDEVTEGDSRLLFQGQAWVHLLPVAVV